MASKIRDNRKKRGRPRTTGIGTLIGVRMSDQALAELDTWIQRAKGIPSRPEAIRRLIELGLAREQPAGRRSPQATAKASAMAAKQLDKLGNASISEDERNARKRRLIKGPREFRDIRDEQRKQKAGR